MASETHRRLPRDLQKELLEETGIIQDLLNNRAPENIKDMRGVTFIKFIDDNKDCIVRRESIYDEGISWEITDWDEQVSCSEKQFILQRKLDNANKEIKRLRRLMMDQGVLIKVLVNALIHETYRPDGSGFQKAQDRNKPQMKL